MPPQPGPPQSRPPHGRTPGWVWALLTVLVVAVLVVGTVTIVDLQRREPEGPIASPPPASQGADGYGQPNTSPSGEFTGEHLVEQLNAALGSQNREVFFSYVGGDATEPLELWWDNMDALGWTTGGLSMSVRRDAEYTDNSTTQQITLGGVTAGSPQIPADSDHPDAGLSYAASNRYEATIHVTDDGASGSITGWEAQDATAPWDLEPLYSVISEHAVVAGYRDESDLVDGLAEAAEESAEWVIDTYQSETGVANAQRFLTFVSDDDERFNSWFITDGEDTGWTTDRAGTMFPQPRPEAGPGLDPTIATGDRMTYAGGIVTVGPNGLQYGTADTTDTLVHEFVHAIHQTNVPRDTWAGSVVWEGWATYNESLFQGNGTYAPRLRYTGRTLRGCVRSMDGSFPVENDFEDAEDVNCAYSLSGSLFAYAASEGVDVYALADEAVRTGDRLWDLAEESDGVQFTEHGWDEWLEQEFG